ncbi:MAG TPA: hypothetical protein VNO32_31480 [Candidatus Acidoferrum sp.]|nr:hypothetical protein [Candidatus Acidoferrum sp.]
MTTLSFTTRLAFIGLISACSTFFCVGAASQTPPPQSDTITVKLSIDKEQVAIGQSPWAILIVRNLSNHEMPIHGWMYRVHVEGEKGEPPTTQVQRQMTGRLRPGEAALRGDEFEVPIISPGKSYIHKFKLDYLYALSVPGEYTVYVEVMDPSTQKSSTQKWLRTNTVQFTMQASNH